MVMPHVMFYIMHTPDMYCQLLMMSFKIEYMSESCSRVCLTLGML